MSTAVASRIITPEEFLAMPDSKFYELVGGRLLERCADPTSSWVGGEVFTRLSKHATQDDLGLAWPAGLGHRCFTHDSNLIRRPNVSFVRKDRLPWDVLSQGWLTTVPDIVVEVVSFNERASTLEHRLEDFRMAQVPLIWVIYPRSRTALIHRADGSLQHLEETDELSGEDIIPGFRCPLGEIFPPLEQLTSPTDSSLYWEKRMADFAVLLQSIAKRPGMYVGTGSIRDVSHYLEGYCHALKDAGQFETPLDGWTSWIELRYLISDPGWHWTRILLHVHGTDQYAMEAIPQLHKEFLEMRTTLGVHGIDEERDRRFIAKYGAVCHRPSKTHTVNSLGKS